MTTTLNLIGPKIKKEIRKTTYYITAINNLIWLCLAFLLSSILIFASSAYLASSADSLDSIKVQTPLDQEILTINNSIQQVKKIQTDYIKWSRVLNNIATIIPAGNNIKQIKIDKNSNQMTISGTSATRNNFLKLKQNLENFDMVSSIDSPISNLLHQTNINFILTAELKLL